MIKAKRIIAFGCSYTTGEELLYHRLGALDDYRKETASDPRKFFNKLTKDDQVALSQIRKDRLELAWPNLLGIPAVNYAEAGNSLDKIIWQIEQLIDKNEVVDGDLILVGLTKPSRNVFFKDYAMSFQLPSLAWPIKDRPLGVAKDGNDSVLVSEEVDRNLLHWFNDDRILWDYIKSLKHLRQLQSKLKIFVVPAMSIDTNLSVREYNSELFKNLISELHNSDLFIKIPSMDDLSDNDNMLWGHPSKETHRKFANEILRKLQTLN